MTFPGLRAGLFLSVGSIVVGFVPIAVLVALSHQRTLADAQRHLGDVAEIGASIAEEGLVRIERELLSFAQATALERSPVALRSLEAIVYDEPFVREVGIVDADGRLVYSTAPGLDAPFEVAAETRADPAIAGLQLLGRFRTRLMQRESIIAALAVPGRGEVNVLLDPNYLSLPFEHVVLGDTGRIVFSDGQGRTLASTGPAVRTVVDAAAPEPEVRAEVAALEGKLVVAAIADRDRILEQWSADLPLAALVGVASSAAAAGTAVLFARRRRGLHQELRVGIERGELSLEYQPILDLETGTCRAAEALMRWKHPVQGRVGPAVFIPVAEQSDLIEPLTAWLLERVVTDLPALSAVNPDLRISVNCPCSLFDRGRLSRLLERWVLGSPAAARLVIEITEDSFVGERAHSIASTMDELRGSGIRFALDDFGTGYSGLGAIKDLRFDYLKIDRSFVQLAGREGAGTFVLDALVDLASKLGAEPVAEGIETAEQCRHVRSRSVRLGQGWLFARSLDVENFVAFARRAPPSLDPSPTAL